MANALPSPGDSVRFLVRRIVRCYYSTIEISGRENIPQTGPVLFVANHANSLIDPVIVGLVAGRKVHFLAKAPLFKIPLFGLVLKAFGMLPAYRGSDDPSQVGGNVQSLASAATALGDGEAVGIFPEGKSHDALKVDKVRSGAARIAIPAFKGIHAASGGAIDLKIVPIGINYQRKERFRSSIWVRVGKPISMAEWKEQIAQDERAGMRALTAEIDSRLKEVVIHLDEEKWEPFLGDLEVFVPPIGDTRKSPIAALRQRKRIADAMNYFLATDRPRAGQIAAEIEAHRNRVEAAGLDVRSDLFRLRYAKLFVRQSWDLIFLLIGFVPAILGTVYNILPVLVTRLAGLLFPKSNRSTVSLQRLGVGLPILGGWYAFLWFRLADYFVPWVATTWSVLMVLAGLFALNYWPRAQEMARLWWCELRMVLQRERLEELRQAHIQLRGRLEELAREYRKIRPVEEQVNRAWWNWMIIRRVATWVAAIALVALIGSWGWSSLRRNRSSILHEHAGLPLASLQTNQLAAFLAEDEKSLVQLVHGLADLERDALQVKMDIVNGRRDFYTQQDNDAIRRLLFSYLSYRTELLRILWKYQNYREVSDESLRLRTFLLDLTAAAALYETSFKVVTEFAQSPEAIRKLNEGEPLWEIPSGLYDMIRANLAAPKNRQMFAAALAEYDAAMPRLYQFGLVENPPYDVFHRTIKESRSATANLDLLATDWNTSAPLEDAQKIGKQALYKGQSFVSTWVGDTRIRQPRQGQPLIQPKQLEELRGMLKPGDILIERQNWYLSRAFMPGYWAHAALYVGTTNDLVQLGLDKDPRVQKFWSEFATRDASGHEHVILEAVPRGVRVTTLEHCIGVADSAAVLRPRIAPEKLPEVIARAFVHLGKPYDFEFDFFSTDKLVCTELVYRCCDKEIQFPLVEVLGRKTLPPTEIVRMFATQRGTSEAQLDFVAFLDGEESQGKAHFSTEEEFAKSVNRPSLTWLQEK